MCSNLGLPTPNVNMRAVPHGPGLFLFSAAAVLVVADCVLVRVVITQMPVVGVRGLASWRRS